jgi:hypothetical protein
MSFQNLPLTVRALRRHLQDVVRHAGIGAGDTIQNPIERYLRVAVAVLTGFDQLCGLAHSLRADENDLLFFR